MQKSAEDKMADIAFFMTILIVTSFGVLSSLY